MDDDDNAAASNKMKIMFAVHCAYPQNNKCSMCVCVVRVVNCARDASSYGLFFTI